MHPEDIIHQVASAHNLTSPAVTYKTINNLYKEFRIIFPNNLNIPYKTQLQFRKDIRAAFPKRLRENALIYSPNINTFICHIKD